MGPDPSSRLPGPTRCSHCSVTHHRALHPPACAPGDIWVGAQAPAQPGFRGASPAPLPCRASASQGPGSPRRHGATLACQPVLPPLNLPVKASDVQEQLGQGHGSLCTQKPKIPRTAFTLASKGTRVPLSLRLVFCSAGPVFYPNLNLLPTFKYWEIKDKTWIFSTASVTPLSLTPLSLIPAPLSLT